MESDNKWCVPPSQMEQCSGDCTLSMTCQCRAGFIIDDEDLVWFMLGRWN